jgi:hypothetical protein
MAESGAALKLCPGVMAGNITSPVTPAQSVLAPSRTLPAEGRLRFFPKFRAHPLTLRRNVFVDCGRKSSQLAGDSRQSLAKSQAVETAVLLGKLLPQDAANEFHLVSLAN